jgi:hypothetical protein
MIDELLNKLDAYARGVDEYEYGLPIYHDSEHNDALRKIVNDWLILLMQEEKERD